MLARRGRCLGGWWSGLIDVIDHRAPRLAAAAYFIDEGDVSGSRRVLSSIQPMKWSAREGPGAV
jgi:hypothetical protein